MKALLIIGAIAGAGSIVGADMTSFPSYETEVSRLGAEIAAIGERLQTAPRSSLDHEKASVAFEERARLTGGFADYASAESLLVSAFELAPAGAGPFLTRAALHYTMHRFDEVEDDLAAFERKLLLNTRERAAIAGLRGDVAMQSADMESAEQFYRASIDLRRDMKSVARLAMLFAQTERREEADLLYREAESLYHGTRAYPVAWILLQRAGNARMRGDTDAALALCDEAEHAFPGWWITEMERAEIMVAGGDRKSAIALLQSATRGRERPELERRLAAVYLELGMAHAAASCEHRAQAIEKRWELIFPESVHAHGSGKHTHGEGEHTHSRGQSHTHGSARSPISG